MPVEIPTAELVRRHSRASLPRLAPITNIDLDVTEGCNLRCAYCFKGPKSTKDMPLSVAKAAVDWLLEARGHGCDLQVNFMGGEPTLRFHDLCVPLTLYGKRKARGLGVQITFTATTNLTLVTPEMVEFWDRWNSGWLCSIDGTPETQNTQRPFADGGPSSEAVERGARLILSTRPHLPARSTIHPSNVEDMAKSFRHLVSLGFRRVMMAFADPEAWAAATLEMLDSQMTEIREEVIGHFRAGEKVTFAAFDALVQEIILPETEGFVTWALPSSCGAGRGMAMVDPDGNLWPCHRFNGADRDAGAQGAFCLGNIFGEFNHDLQRVFLDRDHAQHRKRMCATCKADRICGGGCPAANLQQTGDIYTVHSGSCAMFDIFHRQSSALHSVLMKENNPLYREHLKSLRSTARSAAPPKEGDDRS